VRRAVALALLVACDRRAPIASCGEDLRGVYAAGDQRWMMLDTGDTLEAYPLFPDAPATPGLEVAPRVIDLTRTPDGLAGFVRRRYMQGTARCEAKVPVRVTACAADALELVVADPTPPLAFEPCSWPRREPSRVERWVRQ
jgi:hypothetical protein